MTLTRIHDAKERAKKQARDMKEKEERDRANILKIVQVGAMKMAAQGSIKGRGRDPAIGSTDSD